MNQNLIRKKREALGISQVRLGNLVGLASCCISDFELGKREPWPKARRLLARALKTTQKELFPED